MLLLLVTDPFTRGTGRTWGCGSGVEVGNGERGLLCSMAGPRVWMDSGTETERVTLALTC